jgi:thiosulfate/3-mercaptopyruvate sulfurtransferase
VSDPLVSVADLRDLLGTVTVLDVRYRMGGPPGAPEFEAGHVPGASYVDLDRDLAGAPGIRGRHPLPEPEDFQTAMRAAGVRGDRPVVAYDDWAGRAAARCWWLLRWAGHDDVRVLDGGWSAWLAAGGPRESGTTRPAPGDLTVRAGSMPTLRPEEVPDVGTLVDARAPERYRGEVEPIDPVAGHIPGALNVPTEANLDADGFFRTADALREVYAAVGGDVAVYCGSGVTACHDLVALERAGVRAALYPGSWSEWVSDPGRPVETSDG